MKVTICGSIAFYDEMQKQKEVLEALGHEVKLPPGEIMDDTGKTIPVQQYYAIRKAASDDERWIWDQKRNAMRAHFDKVAWSDAIFVLNPDKNNVAGYVGANTLLEMGLAMHLNKKIFLLNQIPNISYKEEILGMHPVVINGDLTQLV